MTASALYTGTVRHRRSAAPAREFRHRVAFAYLDLDELQALVGGRLVRRWPGIVRVRRRDLLGGAGDGRDVRTALRELIAQRTGRPAADGPLRVLTAPRTLGVCFNPVSFYYSFDADERLDAVVAEVTNTPWGQRHAYVLRAPVGTHPGVLRGEHAKALHVSPFQPMQRRHGWTATVPGPTLGVRIANLRDGAEAADFEATLQLRRRPLTARSLRDAGAWPLRTLALIYGHALALRLRDARRFRNPTTARAR